MNPPALWPHFVHDADGDDLAASEAERAYAAWLDDVAPQPWHPDALHKEARVLGWGPACVVPMLEAA